MSDPLAPLLPLIADGDRQALADLYRAMEKPVFRFIRSKLNDPFESADILHEVFMEVWRSADKFEGRSKVQTWVFGIAYRKTIDVHRKGARTQLTDEVPDTADDSADAETSLSNGQEAEMVRHCIGTLKPEFRETIQLAFWDDMTYGQIAEVAGVPEGTVKTRVFHAKKLLMRCLEGLVRRAAS